MTESVVLVSSLLYVLLLFAIASYADRATAKRYASRARPFVYAFSIAIYCTSWTFFGSVGLASERGIEYLGIYIGPILVFTFGYSFLQRIARLSKAERITSVADMLAARYGKSFGVASLATIIAVMAAVPYIAIQLKAISESFELFTKNLGGVISSTKFVTGDFSFLVALALAVFGILFGTRHADATEHQNGLITAVAVESVLKLAAFLAVGVGVTFVLFGTPSELIQSFAENEKAMAALNYRPTIGTWSVLIFLSAFAIILLPRQFHVLFVENRDTSELKTAAWLFPLYLVLINMFVMPIALLGLTKLPADTPADLFVLALPLSQGAHWLSLITFIGGLSAATAMVIVSSVALSIMISNHLVLPMVLRFYAGKERSKHEDLPKTILHVRRVAISAILVAAYLYYQEAATNFRLASIGLISFAAIAQFAPAFIGGMFWRNANARGAMWGMGAGTLVWLYTLMFPTLAGVDNAVVKDGLLGIAWLRPQHLLGLQADPLVHGVVWSLVANTLFLIAASLSRQSTPLERIQASIFVPRDVVQMPNLRRMRTGITVEQLKATTARYLGSERTERSFQSFEKREGRTFVASSPADPETIRFTEQLLASAVGSSSARLILSLLFQRNEQSPRNAYRLLDDASEALQQNRDLLQIALDQMEQGITVLDNQYRLTCWNRRFRWLFDLPDEFGQVGTQLSKVIEFLIDRGDIEIGTERQTIERLNKFGQPWQVELASSGRIVEIRSNPMPDGGIVATYTDITARVRADEALKKVNESLEQRVEARTAELSRVNGELTKAQSLAEEANLGKTRFLAAAGHDILQPLNAARLYSASLIEKLGKSENETIVSNIESSLDSVETILSAVLDISRLDTGALKPNISTFQLGALLKQIETDFAPLATKKNLKLRVVKTSVFVKTDRNLLQRLIQNLVSNAIKYSRTGSILLGVRRRKGSVEIQVLDTGIGIAEDKTKVVFREFTRLEDGMREAEGLGLGLSIVDRISRVLKLSLAVTSRVNRGTMVKVTIGTVARPKDHIETAVRQMNSPVIKLPPMKLMCIDNDPRIIDGMTTLLTGWGCRVDAFSNGQSALNHKQKPDAILADYHLDNENGLQVISKLRAEYGQEVPALLITADRSNEVRHLAESMDVIVLNKPVKPAALRAALMRNRFEAAAE